MTYLVERLAELRRHLDHLQELRSQVPDGAALRRDLSLHNDVLFSLLTVCQLVINISGELSARRALPFEDYTQAVRNLAHLEVLDTPTLEELERLPGFRNVIVHEYVALDMNRVVEAMDMLEPIERFAEAIRQILADDA